MQKPNKLYVIPLDTFVTEFEEILHAYSPMLNSVLPYYLYLPEIMEAAMGVKTRAQTIQGRMGTDLLNMGLPSDIVRSLIVDVIVVIERLLLVTLFEKAHHTNYRYRVHKLSTLYFEEIIHGSDSDESEEYYS